MTSTAVVPTSKPVVYLRQLCRAFGQEAETDEDHRRGRIALPFGRCEVVACIDRLTLQLTAKAREDLTRMEELLASQLERFAGRDGLAVAWQRLG